MLMAQSKEYYRAQPMGVNGTFKVGGTHISGFLCAVAGTLTVTDADGTVLVDAQPVVTATPWTRIPLLFNTAAGGSVTLAGGAKGTLFL
jgi:hypothetical protein